MYIFNPEHDLCLANGDPNFVPPASSLKFGADCNGVVGMICGVNEAGEAAASCGWNCIVPWGWNAALKGRLVKAGVPESLLPSDSALQLVRELSHRRTSVLAGTYIREHVSDKSLLVKSVPEEMDDPCQLLPYLERYGAVVLKSPWSGSGKGLRWVSEGTVNETDLGWCRNVIARQGSVIVEKREQVVRDFAMLFHIGKDNVSFEGYSLFYTGNGAYSGSVLASDSHILDSLSAFVPYELLLEVRELVAGFLTKVFVGNYEGFAGVDMFLCRSDSGYLLSPCVEINVRMTMGLLARRCYDHLLPPVLRTRDGHYRMEVVHSADPARLHELLSPAVLLLTEAGPGTNYAIAVYG